MIKNLLKIDYFGFEQKEYIFFYFLLDNLIKIDIFLLGVINGRN